MLRLWCNTFNIKSMACR